ncbi:putative aromatic compound monooxygenase YhjG [Madurella mycetomatis]|uniref:Aromatic compound monooxygenase YhjG n=1 Tax=Madurella mycetomatis TaxID=100816 RepID=A0A175WCJ7_9PEZI|nr:putative aromatic compound monooxygenase YhjG [Madurella mycetomatis]
MTYECDVLIVGAGPVGTTLALELALHGVSFRIIDQAPVRSDKSRSLVIQPRTLELLNRHGAVDALVRRGRSLHGGTVYLEKQAVVGFDLDNLDITGTEFPLLLNVSQAETEKFLDECLSKYDISVQRPITATEIIQDKDGVTTTLKTADGKTDTIRTKYVVGCDGAHSVVRKAADLTFKGAPYPQDFLLCDVHLRDSNLPQDRVGLHLGPKGVLALLPFDNEIIRIVASGYQIIAENEGEPTLEQFQTYFTATTPPGSGTLHDPIWMTRFRLHHRGVNRYRDGRLFVAGDAAHIHSPAGGQGMNAGIQDAINLGWKLALALAVLREDGGKASSSPPSAARAEALLDSYNAERHPVGRMLLKRTDRMFTFISSSNPFYVLIRNFFVKYVMPFVVRSEKRRLASYQLISQLGVTYRGSSKIVGTAKGFQGPVRGGDRLLDGGLLLPTEDGGGAARETTLHHVCVGAAHHFLVFAGSAEADGPSAGKASDEKQLVTAAEEVTKTSTSDVQVHYIRAGDVKLCPRAAEWYTDPEGRLHEQFGFGSPGYVFVRPDGYVAHIGPLAKLDQLISFLKG